MVATIRQSLPTVPRVRPDLLLSTSEVTYDALGVGAERERISTSAPATMGRRIGTAMYGARTTRIWPPGSDRPARYLH